MALIDDYIQYAEEVRLYFVKNSTVEGLENLRRTAKRIQDSWYGVSIEPPRLADGLDASLELLEKADSAEWEKFLRPIVTGFGPLNPNSQPLFHSLVNLRDLFERSTNKTSN